MKRIQLPAAESAIATLQDYALLSAQAEVFSYFFPRQSKNPKLLDPGPSSRFSRMEEKLVAKLQQLFQTEELIDDYQWEDEELEPLREIPFRPWFPHDDESIYEYVDHLPEAERLAALLTWNRDYPDELGQQIAEAFSLNSPPGPIQTVQDLRPVLDTFQAQQPPIRFFADSLRIVNRTTGNYWFDGICACGGGCGCGIPWNIADIKAIASQLKLASRISKQVGQLSRWIRENPNTNIPHLIRLFSPQTV